MEDHPLNPNPSSNWQTFFKYCDFHIRIFICMIFTFLLSWYEWQVWTLFHHSLSRDNDVLLQIDKDVRRLCPDLTFFQQVTVWRKACNWISKTLTWVISRLNNCIFQATPHPHRLLVGDPDEGVPPREKLHARVTQVMLLQWCFPVLLWLKTDSAHKSFATP